MHNTYTPSKNETFKKYQAIEPPFEYMEVPYINYEPPHSSKYLICSTFLILLFFAQGTLFLRR